MAHLRAVPELAWAREATWPALRFASGAWACEPNSTCARAFRSKHCVRDPIGIGSTLLIPMHAFAPGLPPLQGPGRQRALFCHKVDCFTKTTSARSTFCYGGPQWNGTFETFLVTVGD